MRIKIIADHMKAIVSSVCHRCEKKYPQNRKKMNKKVANEKKQWKGCDYCKRWFCGKCWGFVLVKWVGQCNAPSNAKDMCFYAHTTTTGQAYRYIDGTKVDLMKIARAGRGGWLSSAEIGISLDMIHASSRQAGRQVGGLRDPDRGDS